MSAFFASSGRCIFAKRGVLEPYGIPPIVFTLLDRAVK
jgi:hypothetical protein